MNTGLRLSALRLTALVLMAVMGMLSGCATPNAIVEIKGQALYRERIALPADAKVIVQLLDVSEMDVPAIVMAERVQQGAAIPAPFSFAMGSDQFQPGHSYAIGARIMLGDKLLFINTHAYPIDLNATEPMTILLEKVGD
ncbi:YbaY family lipoprotein [Shewanella glacialipiscicola]|uniref:YbaY family lipoprotein n=1 Tax=Shewanella glacialipiscicola TaxID=614069 RepID=UPI003D7B1220